MENNKKKYLYIGLIFVFILVIVVVYFLFFNKPSTKGPVYVDCTFKATDVASANTEYETKLFVSEMTSTYSYKDINQNLTTRTFSISDLENYKTDLKEDIFFTIHKTGGGSFGKIVGADLQVCNSQNKSTSVGFINSSSETISGMTLYVHGGSRPVDPGVYRVDAMIEVDGVKYLVARMENVQFTE